MRPSGFYYPDAVIRLFAAVERYVWCRVKTGNDKRGFETTRMTQKRRERPFNRTVCFSSRKAHATLRVHDASRRCGCRADAASCVA
jgi:hypothetical protein